MPQGQSAGLSYLKKVFYFTHLMGLTGGILLPFAAWSFFGGQAFAPGFILISLLFGYFIAVTSFFFIRNTLKKQLRIQLELLAPLTGKLETGEESLESLTLALETGVGQVQRLVGSVM